jgi:cytochrome P450
LALNKTTTAVGKSIFPKSVKTSFSLGHSLQLNEENKFQEVTKNEILHEMLLFLVAGLKITSAVLSWFIRSINRSPQSLTIEQLDLMVCLNAVIKEVLLQI